MPVTHAAIPAALALSGVAAASPFFGSTGVAPHDEPPTIVRGLGLYNIDLAGIQSWDAAGSANNHRLSVFIGAFTTVQHIGWENVVIETAGGSWLREARINFLNSSAGLSLVPAADDAFGGIGGPYASDGLVDLATIDPAYPFQVGADGMLHLEFFESFDNASDALDATWISGTLSINFPAPGGVGAALAGLFAAARRRR
jgi:hypothetical protein